jgi:hypothetical protein
MSYVNAFIQVAADTKASMASSPIEKNGRKTIAVLEFELIANHPYEYTQEEVQFHVHLQRAGVSAAEAEKRHQKLWLEFFSKPCACMRTSPLPKTYGWGLHFNAEGKVAVVPVGSKDYQRLKNDPSIQQFRAMQSKRG